MKQPPASLQPPVVNSIRKVSSLSEMAYEAMRDAIINGRIRPGERLMQVELARKLGVSERTVREAFARLVAKGLAVSEPYKGVRVAALPLEDLKEIYTIRALLEGHAIELAAERITEDQLYRMEELLPLTSAGDNAEGMHSAQDANREFHWIPIQAAGSQYLIRILDQLWELMFTYDVIYREAADERRQSRENDLQQHDELLRALAARDAQKAKEINTAHIYRTLEKLVQRLNIDEYYVEA